MKVIAWNLNSLRRILKTKHLTDLIKEYNPDVFCMGETKLSCPYDNIDLEIKTLFPKFKYRYWSSCSTKNGYSGTAILSKKKPLSHSYGIEWQGKTLDWEGRVITLEFEKYYLIHVYTPNSGRELKRLDFRTKEWDRAFEEYIIKLQKTKPVIACGDLNVAHKNIDIKNYKTNKRTAGFTDEEKASFDTILEKTKMIDSFRKQNPETIKYSYWSSMGTARERNIGWRLDYFLLSNDLKYKKSDILDNVLGSDHAPIILEI
jgi:exodeoxyribonuclease-3